MNYLTIRIKHESVMYCNLLLLVMLSASITLSAQRKYLSADSAKITEFANEAKKEAGYKAFSDDMQALMKKGNAKNTQAAAVKALLIKNKVMLEKIYNRIKVSNPAPGDGGTTTKTPAKKIDITHNEFKKFKPLGNSMERIETAPFDAKFRHHNYGNSPHTPDTSLSNSALGKLGIVYAFPAPVGPWDCTNGLMMYGYTESFAVPNNPAIVAARITCEYDWSYTGWDTYGSVRGVDLTIATTGITGPDINTLLAKKYNHGYNYAPWYCQAANLVPVTTQTTEFADYAAGQDSCSYTFTGYVFPGTTIECRIGIGNVNGNSPMFRTSGGVNGYYQYTYFRLKKIRVNFLKAGE
jgi:hypothetical protein